MDPAGFPSLMFIFPSGAVVITKHAGFADTPEPRSVQVPADLALFEACMPFARAPLTLRLFGDGTSVLEMDFWSGRRYRSSPFIRYAMLI